MNTFRQQIKQWFHKEKDRRPFQLIQIETSLQCSLDCVMCPWTEMRAQGGAMSLNTFQRIAPHLSQAKDVDLTGGGEPLTNPDLVDMVRCAKEAGCRVGFSTNAVRLTPDLAQKFVDAGLDWISFSMDAATPERYERIRQGAKFETVTGNIAYLRDLKQRLGLEKPQTMMVFVAFGGEADLQNYRELPLFIPLAKELGIEQVIIKNLDVILNAEDDSRRLFQHDTTSVDEIEGYINEAENLASQAGIKFRRYRLHPQEQAICEHHPTSSLFINWEGWVSPCVTQSYAQEKIFAGELRKTGCLRFGNVNQMSIDEIWTQPEYQEFREKFVRRINTERRQMFSAFLNDTPDTIDEMPPAPSGCDSCYYLYGI